MVNSDIFEEVVVTEVLVTSTAMKRLSNVHVMCDKSANTLSHFFLTRFVLVGVHGVFFVLGFGRRNIAS
jgi:hypothetical protein